MTTAQKDRIARNRRRMHDATNAGTTGEATMVYVAPERQDAFLRTLSDIADSKRELGTMRPVQHKPKK